MLSILKLRRLEEENARLKDELSRVSRIAQNDAVALKEHERYLRELESTLCEHKKEIYEKDKKLRLYETIISFATSAVNVPGLLYGKRTLILDVNAQEKFKEYSVHIESLLPSNSIRVYSRKGK